jgi:hypothetical protein
MLTKFFKKDHFPLLLLLVCFLAFGIFIPFLGFYWDDFPYMWFKHTTGILGVIKAIALDRPVLGVFYAIPMSILGETPWIWQIFAIFCRWVFVLCVFQFLNKVFPEHLKQSKFLILLFSVFPGFSQQWISVIYSHAFLIFALYFFSLSLFIDLVNQEKSHWSKLLIPIFLSILCLLATEYMAGIEVLRPFIIYRILSRKYPDFSITEKLKKTLTKWAPYLFSMMFFLFYRIFIASSVLYKVQKLDSFATNPSSTLFDLIQVQLINVYSSTILVWWQITKPFLKLDLSSFVTKVYLVITVSVFIITFLVVYKSRPNLFQNSSNKNSWMIDLSVGSLLSLFFVGIPFWAANLRPEIHFPNDRIFIPFMLGSSALLFLLIWSTINKRITFAILFSLIFSLSLSYHVYEANNYRTDWDNLKQFFQQLSWRIPSLDKNSTIITSGIGLNYYSDNSLTSPLNLIYSEQKPKQLDYLLYFTDVRLGLGLKTLEKGIPITQGYRSFSFKGNTSNMIDLKFNPPSCLQIMDRIYSNSVTNPNLTELQTEELRMTNLSLIRNQPQKSPPPYLLTNAPEKTWCYYFEKADLARQFGDYSLITELGDKALKYELFPRSASEWLPFLEGYSWMGEWDKVDFILNEISSSKGNFKSGMCYTLRRINNNHQFPYVEKIQEYLKGYNCQ